MRTAIGVEQRSGRFQTRLAGGALRAQVVTSAPSVCRVGLLATTALLLGGDDVELEVAVGPGVCLELFDVAATVAYHGRGRPASWRLQVEVGPGASFRYAGQPLIVAAGADVRRSAAFAVADDAQVLVRETVVLGRAGEQGGALITSTALRAAGRDVWLEEQHLGPGSERARPGLLGAHRVIDTVLARGRPFPPAAPQFRLADGSGTVTRSLGAEVAQSPLVAAWAALVRADQPAART